ncbi:hypothetical protein FJZ36_11650 [Candidatus Poribacteria bacterium]|nr:hypothetical protein [Candidatus Poribacteria bacterium]
MALLAGTLASGLASPGADIELRDVLGVTHVAGKYAFTERNYLNEGADRVLESGSRVIKVWFLNPQRDYPFHSDWQRAVSLAARAGLPYFAELFAKPFTTFVLTVYSVGKPEHYWIHGMTPEDEENEERQFYDLTRHLLTTYAPTGKTFVLQHWEGDWAIRGSFDANAEPTQTAVDGMVAWLNARQRGVDRARREVGETTVRVYHAAEVNLVRRAMDTDERSVTTHVLPRTAVDLVSYSAWDTERDPALFRRSLDFIAERAPDSAPFGDRNVYVGEYGLPETDTSESDVLRTVANVVDIALDWGCPYVIYWQLYCNEPKREPVVKNEDSRGFWLIRPDGSKSPVWDYLRGRMGFPP